MTNRTGRRFAVSAVGTTAYVRSARIRTVLCGDAGTTGTSKVTIYFYTRADEYGDFCNFSSHGFELDDHYWLTVEHFFQAQKFPGTELAEKIRGARTPGMAKNLGRSQLVPLRADWEEIKDEVMYRSVFRKFETHGDLRERLLKTGDEELVENAPGDDYWGCGADGTGLNKLGRILMNVRGQL